MSLRAARRAPAAQARLDIQARFTELYHRRFDLRLGATALRVAATRKGVRLSLAAPTGAQTAEAEVLLVATGRVPNSDRLDVAAAGIDVDAHGHVCLGSTVDQLASDVLYIHPALTEAVEQALLEL